MSWSDIGRPGLVSVVMPSFNHEKFLRDALFSVAEQDYANKELVIVDDCSRDRSYSVINEITSDCQFAGKFQRIVIKKNDKNMGAHWSLNRGISLAEGEFLTFINSDDLYEKNRFSKILEGSLKYKKDFLAYSRVKIIDDYGRFVRSHRLSSVLEVYPTKFDTTLPSRSCGFLRFQLTGSTGNIFLSRSLMNKVGGFRDLKYCHDWDFMLRALFFTEPEFVTDTNYLYRIHGSNSFSSLADVAEAESSFVLRSYFQSICRRNAVNKLAPTPQNWPHLFQALLRKFGIYDFWVLESEPRPFYAKRLAGFHRTEVAG